MPVNEDNSGKPKRQRNKDGDLHKNHRARMRKRYLGEDGIAHFSDHQVLEFLLFYTVPRMDTNDLAHKMIKEYGGVANLINADPVDIMKRCRVGEGAAILINMIPQLSRWYHKLQFEERAVLDTSKIIGEFTKSLLSGRRNECFFCICLDTKMRVISSSLISEGSVAQTEVYPREVAECALKYNASGIILAHNHPSGDLLPSEADITTTHTIKRALDFLDIEVIDHIIVGNNRYFSFAEHKMISY